MRIRLRARTPRPLDLIRHDTAHVLAEAVQALWPGTQVPTHRSRHQGRLLLRFPARDPPSPPTIFRRSRRRCGRSSQGTRPSPRKSGRARRRARSSRRWARLQGGARRRHSRGGGRQGFIGRANGFDLCARGAATWSRRAMWATPSGSRRSRSLLLAGAIPFEARADAHLRHGLARQGRRSTRTSRCSRRPSARDHRKLGREMDLFHFQEEAPGAVFLAQQGLAPLLAPHRLHAASPGCGGYEEINTPELSIVTSPVGGVGVHAESSARTWYLRRSRYDPTYAFQADELPGHVPRVLQDTGA